MRIHYDQVEFVSEMKVHLKFKNNFFIILTTQKERPYNDLNKGRKIIRHCLVFFSGNNSHQSRNRRGLSQPTKGIYEIPTGNFILYRESGCFPIRSGTNKGCPSSQFLFAVLLEALVSTVRQEKSTQFGKEELKLYSQMT